MSAAVSADSILREMTDLWVTLGAPGKAETGMGVLRACSMTLIVVTEEGEDPVVLGETIAALMPVHPARAIILRLEGGPGRQLAAKVVAQCWMPFGQRRQICAEQIEITASETLWEDAVSTAAAIVAPDLPIIVWWRSQRADFGVLGGLATKVVVDSARGRDGKRALEQLAEAMKGGVRLADLAWTRLTLWRQMLAQVFENRHLLEQLPSISKVTVAFGGERPPASAWYMGAWLANALADASSRVSLEMKPDASGVVGQLMRVELEGAGLRTELARRDGRLVIAVGNLTQCTGLPTANDYQLMREELGIVRQDAVFERALTTAVRG